MKKHKNIKFYSADDMSLEFHLREAEAVLQDWDSYISNPDINIVISLYNVRIFFDTGMTIVDWSDDQLADYKEKVKAIPGIIGRFCSTITNSNIQPIYEAIERNYTDDFWQLFCNYKLQQRISPEAIENLLNGSEYIIWDILCHNDIVQSYGQVLTEHLLCNSHTAERLVSYFLEAHDRRRYQLFFPVEFTQEMRNKVLTDYVECTAANINILQLLEEAQNSKEFPISDRFRLKARKKKEVLQEKLFSGSPGITFGVNVTFKSIPDGSIEKSHENNVISCAYSREWIEENRDYPTLLNNFIYLFGYVDRCFRCGFVSLKSDLGVLERHIGVKGKKDYVTGIAFNSKRMLSLLQMAAYRQELQRLDIHIEDIFKWFFEEYLKSEFDANGFTCAPPSEGTTLTEKCKLLSTSIDGVLKQYCLYSEDGFVNRELLEMSSGHVTFSDLSGILENKYVYEASKEIRIEMLLLFSDQFMMGYSEKTGSTYRNLNQLLLSEQMKRDDFAEYQHRNLDWLINRSAISISEAGLLSLNKDRVIILKDLYTNEVICPRYYDKILRSQIDNLVIMGDLRYGSTLFSEPEQKYLNYVLNKSEFSNGLDLRNNYIHDTCSLEEKTQSQDYLELLKIMTLIIIKINEEFCAAN